MATQPSQPEPPIEPVYLEVARYEIDGSIGGGLDDGQVHCHILWRVLHPGALEFFWMRNMNWIPDVHTVYVWSRADGLHAAPEGTRDHLQ